MTGHIFLEGEIGYDVNSKTVRDDIALYPQATEFLVHVNSGGGDVYEGYAIGSILKNIGKPTTAFIGAMCASIATYDALCCDRVIMSPHGDFMIHLPTGSINGNADDLRTAAAQLDRIKSELVDRYMTKVAKKGITKDKVSQMIDNETSMSPAEALAMGFIDEVQEKLKAVAKIDITKFAMKDKEEIKTWFEKFEDKMDKFFKSFNPKNAVTLTLDDGTVVTSPAADVASIIGTILTLADGTALKEGEYKTADGLTEIVVDATGTVLEADAAEAAPADDAKLKEENEALKAELATLKQQQAEAQAAVQTQVTNVKKENEDLKKRITEFKNEFEAYKKETFGDDNPPKDEPKPDFTDKKQQYDPMVAQLGDLFVKDRLNKY